MNKLFRKRDGFTLVELIVVIAVLIILMAIAVPAFLSIRDNAKDASVKSDLVAAYKNARTILAANSDVWPAQATLVSEMAEAEPGFTFVGATASDDEAADETLVITGAGAVTDVDVVFDEDFGPAQNTVYVFLDSDADDIAPAGNDDFQNVELVLAGVSASGKEFFVVENETYRSYQSWE